MRASHLLRAAVNPLNRILDFPIDKPPHQYRIADHSAIISRLPVENDINARALAQINA